jgi:sulfate adenylyltransferase subunit 2
MWTLPYKFREVIEFRDPFCASIGARDRSHESEGGGGRREPVSPGDSEMLRAAEDAGLAGRAGGGARRPRSAFTSFRDSVASGTPRTSVRNCGTSSTVLSIRKRAFAFPRISSWTEPDVWQYIHLEQILLVHVEADVPLLPGEKTAMVMCRMRSLRCSACPGAIRSEADTIPCFSAALSAKPSDR